MPRDYLNASQSRGRAGDGHLPGLADQVDECGLGNYTVEIKAMLHLANT
jgi:hypothetical protein